MEVYQKAKAAADKALELDDALAEAYGTRGWQEMHYEWQWSAAESDMKRAIKLNPNLAVAYDYYSHYLIANGRVDDSVAASIRAKDIAPLDFLSELHLAWHYYFARQFDQSLEHCRKALELEPGYQAVHLFQGWNYEQKGMYEQAIAEYQTIGSPLLGHAYALAGATTNARHVLNDWKQRSERTYVSPYSIAEIYVGLGDYDQAFGWLERAYQERPSAMAYLKVEPRLDPLRSDHRYAELLRRIGLAP
jgi:tetratricopeptide (TPR) repeat protein